MIDITVPKYYCITQFKQDFFLTFIEQFLAIPAGTDQNFKSLGTEKISEVKNRYVPGIEEILEVWYSWVPLTEKFKNFFLGNVQIKKFRTSMGTGYQIVLDCERKLIISSFITHFCKKLIYR